MMYFYLLLFSILLACWFKREIYYFPLRVNQQSYQNYSYLIEPNISYEIFLMNSALKPIKSKLSDMFFVAFPIVIYISFTISNTSNAITTVIVLILIILIFLSLLDIIYYLTDINYIISIFIISLANLLFNENEVIYERILSLLIAISFFVIFIMVINFFFKKESFGLGDVILIIALSPLFDLYQLVLLLLYASLSGIIFYILFFLITKRVVVKLPFIPFITFSTFILFIAKILN